MKKMVMAGALAMLAATAWTAPSAASPFSAIEQLFSHKKAADKPVILAQSADPEMRIQQLEEQIRQLNGRIEEMSFQLLQMQETLRKTQEDNEFRFQELEKGKKSGALEQPLKTQDTAEASGEQTPEASQSLDQPADNAAADPTAEQPLDPAQDPAQDQAMDQPMDQQDLGAPPKQLGQITFDANGNIIDNQPAPDTNQDVAVLPADPIPGQDPVGQIIDNGADTQTPASSDDAYQAAYDTILAGDYASAESQFRSYIDANPQGEKVADASFWLGEAQYSQGKYSDSAKTFLNSYKAYGKSPKAPDMLLKLAMSLAALDSKDTACATLRQVTKSYPKASRAIVTKVASEQKRLAC